MGKEESRWEEKGDERRGKGREEEEGDERRGNKRTRGEE